jgi:hypothetical protein
MQSRRLHGCSDGDGLRIAQRTNRGIEISGRLPSGWLALRRWWFNDQHPGDFGLGRDVRALFRSPGNDVFFCKTPCWFSP